MSKRRAKRLALRGWRYDHRFDANHTLLPPSIKDDYTRLFMLRAGVRVRELMSQ